jgi:hypothetical protein
MGGKSVKISGPLDPMDPLLQSDRADLVRRGGATLPQLEQLQLPGLLASSRSSSRAQRSVSSAVTESDM